MLRQGTNKNANLNLNDKQLVSFEALKKVLSNATLLVNPKADAPLCVLVDASNSGVRGILQQLVDGVWQPLSFFSKQLKPTEMKYCTFSQELLSAYQAVK